jgi:tRNA A37 threonylcarbamoyladenosine dehydratase
MVAPPPCFHVVVIGTGAVGSSAIDTLARAAFAAPDGIPHLRWTLIDHDVVSLSNCNRQLIATSSTVGMPKVDVAAARIRSLLPAARIDTQRRFIEVGTVQSVLDLGADLIVDAFDTLSPKAALLELCARKGVPILSSMGAGRKSDLSSVVVGSFFETTVCPLARRLRSRLKGNGVFLGAEGIYADCVMAIYSKEHVAVPRDERRRRRAAGEAPIPGGRADGDEIPLGSNGKPERCPLGSAAPMTNLFGLHMGHYAWEMLTSGRLQLLRAAE